MTPFGTVTALTIFLEPAKGNFLRSRRSIFQILAGAQSESHEAAFSFLQLNEANENSNATNASWSDTTCAPDLEGVEELGVVAKVFLALILGTLIFSMVLGNLLVILAILMERELQRPQYYLVLSLAVADLMVGIVVSPLSALYDINRQWHLGVPMCDFWILCDVLACTASILHLVAIAVDRYWSITDVSYMQKRTVRRIGYMIAVVWGISFCVSVAPMLGWKDSQFHCRVEVRNECLISQDPGYQIFSTTTAFYGPLVLICILYWKIYKAAKTRIQMQVKRRSNTAAAQIRAKLIAQQTQMEEASQNAISSADAIEVDGAVSVYTAHDVHNGHGPRLANGGTSISEKVYPKKSTVQIRLVQPSSATASGHHCEAETSFRAASGNGILANKVMNSSYSFNNDENSNETAVIANSIIQSQESMEFGVDNVTQPAMSLKKCNGILPHGSNEGGTITTAPDGSVDLSTEDEAEYIDGIQSPTAGNAERKKISTSSAGPSTLCPPRRPVQTTPSQKMSSTAPPSPSPRHIVYSQTEVTSATIASATRAATVVVGQKRRRLKSKREIAESSRERRAGRTLAIITGIFVVSWLPFFILALVGPLCGDDCAMPKPIGTFFAWLGYVNSAINPVIYTIFSPDFRNAFKRTLRRFCLV